MKIACGYAIARSGRARDKAEAEIKAFCTINNITLFSTWIDNPGETRELDRAARVIKAGIASCLVKHGAVDLQGADIEVIGTKTSNRFRGGWLPFGWRLRGNQLVIDPEEQELVSEAIRQRADGESLKSIAEFLNKSDCRRRCGQTWDHNSVYQMLKVNAKYMKENGRGG